MTATNSNASFSAAKLKVILDHPLPDSFPQIPTSQLKQLYHKEEMNNIINAQNLGSRQQ